MALLRPENSQQARLVRLLRDDGPRSRVEVGDIAGLSRSTLTAELDRLIARGLVETAGPAASRGGRRSSLLRLAGGVRFASVVVAPDRVSVAVTDGELCPLAETGAVVDARGGPEPVITRAVELIEKLRADLGVAELTGVGIALPGAVDGGASVAPAALPGWQRFPVRDAFAAALGCPALVDNDANVFALGEQHAGIGRTFDDFLYLKLGPAIGCGLVLGGALHRGATSAAGDIAHLSLDEDGPVCGCGEAGCLQAYCGDEGLVRSALAIARSGRSAALAARLAEAGTLTVPDVAATATAGDPATQILIRDAARRLGRVLVGLVSFVNPGILVIGGAPEGLGHVLLAEIRGVVYRRSAPLATGTMPIVLSDLADRAGLVGAARLVSEHVFSAG
ncbi:ROK family transcriptional regulator [Micromonospora endophytica]|uniref:Sugar kinase n=1 Tax=Micromonospora endophytica TaxID=515350 RepID=A0A2W2CLA4_9ACTN|nr:ROK family transcriptional regulator [Micromonospora endophytica]PZG00282.1 sugar kinase [Micromonospora endophytica]RIW47418.1 ROK family transcriptional regulator [Micromonospora endophytica]